MAKLNSVRGGYGPVPAFWKQSACVNLLVIMERFYGCKFALSKGGVSFSKMTICRHT